MERFATIQGGAEVDVSDPETSNLERLVSVEGPQVVHPSGGLQSR
jgi:hypothetical protein